MGSRRSPARAEWLGLLRVDAAARPTPVVFSRRQDRMEAEHLRPLALQPCADFGHTNYDGLGITNAPNLSDGKLARTS